MHISSKCEKVLINLINAPDCGAYEISTHFTGVKSPKCGLNIRFRPLFSTYDLTLTPNSNPNNGIAYLRIVDLRNLNSEPVSNSRPQLINLI